MKVALGESFQRTNPSSPAPAARPLSTVRTDPSSPAGISSPAIEATPITPAAKPSSNGVSCAARSPRKKTGTAPMPVASAVPEAAISSRTTSGMDGT
jgi:hypothetical protein